MERRLKPVRSSAMGIIALALIISGPSLGWWTLAPLIVALAGFVYVDARLDRFRRPEYALAGAWMMAQAMIAMAVFISGGPESPAISWLVIPVVTLGARFDMRGVVSGVAFTAFLMLAVTVGHSPSAVLAEPYLAASPLCLLLAVAILSTALMRSDLDHRKESVLDNLTGMLNRRSLGGRVHELGEQAAITGDPIGVIVGDLDHFKTVNDTHGHQVGDAVLVDVAYSIRKELRAFDLAYRLGGEEFLVLLPGATAAEALELAGRLREAVEGNRAGGLDVTMSFGVSSSGGGAFDYDTIFAAADAALYRAKQNGRNRVEAAGATPALVAA